MIILGLELFWSYISTIQSKCNEALKEMRRSQGQKAAVNDLGLILKKQSDSNTAEEIGASSYSPVARINKTLAEKSKTPVANSKSNEPSSTTSGGGGAIPKHKKNLPQDSGNSMQSINADDAMTKRSRKRRC